MYVCMYVCIYIHISCVYTQFVARLPPWTKHVGSSDCWPLPKHLTRRTPSRSLDHLTNRRQRTDLLYLDVHPTYVGNNHIIPRYIMICGLLYPGIIPMLVSGRYLCYTWVIHHLTGMRLRVSKSGIVILGTANETWLKPPTSQIKLKHPGQNVYNI